MSSWQIIACSVPSIRRKRLRGGERRPVRKRENYPTSLWQPSLDFKDIVVLLRNDLFIHKDGSGLGHSQLLFISDSKDEKEIVLTPTQHQGIGKSRFFQWNYSMIYLFCLSISFCSLFYCQESLLSFILNCSYQVCIFLGSLEHECSRFLTE